MLTARSFVLLFILWPLSFLAAAQSTPGTKFYLQAFVGNANFFANNTGRGAPANSVEIKTFNFSAVAPVDVATGQASGKVRISPFALSRPIDVNTPAVFQALVTNQVFTKMVITTLQSTATGKFFPTLVYTLTNVEFSSFSHDQTLTEQLTLRFQKIEIDYTGASASTTAVASF